MKFFNKSHSILIDFDLPGYTSTEIVATLIVFTLLCEVFLQSIYGATTLILPPVLVLGPKSATRFGPTHPDKVWWLIW